MPRSLNPLLWLTLGAFSIGTEGFGRCCLDHLHDGGRSDRCPAPCLGARVARFDGIGVAIDRCKAEVPIRSA